MLNHASFGNSTVTEDQFLRPSEIVFRLGYGFRENPDMERAAYGPAF